MRAIIATSACLLFLMGCASQVTRPSTLTDNPASTNAPAIEFGTSDLIGIWNGKGRDGTYVTYWFHEDGDVAWIVEEPNSKSQEVPAFLAKYTIREKAPFWEIDVHDFENPHFRGYIFRGIIQPLGERKFRMDGLPSSHGRRPKKFGKDTIEFSKTNTFQIRSRAEGSE